jgi:hypothetical protein
MDNQITISELEDTGEDTRTVEQSNCA